MCGRFVVSTPAPELASLLGVDGDEWREATGPRYNIAPSADIIVLSTRPERTLGWARWGLIPSWSRDPSIGARLTNARAETVWEKPSFRNAVRRHRCIIPMDGFYEWAPATPDGPRNAAGRPVKRPHLFRRADGDIIRVAGMCSEWTDPNDPAHHVLTTAIITCAANDTMSPIHHRMPVILDPVDCDEWLESDDTAHLLRPAPETTLTVIEVGTAVNDARNQGPELIAPVQPEPRLF